MMRAIDKNEIHYWFDFSTVFHRTVKVRKMVRMRTTVLRDYATWPKEDLIR